MHTTDGGRARDAHAVLGTTPDDDLETVRRAYRRALLRAHPDHGGGTEKVRAVLDAWQILCQAAGQGSATDAPSADRRGGRAEADVVTASRIERSSEEHASTLGRAASPESGPASAEGVVRPVVDIGRARAAYRAGNLTAVAPSRPVVPPSADRRKPATEPRSSFAAVLARAMRRPVVELRAG